MSNTDEIDDCYGIVIDAGSSGSRIHIYKWKDPSSFDQSSKGKEEQDLLHSVPQIYQEKDWTYKVTPGLSSYEYNTKKSFSEHINPLLTFAKDIIPASKIKNTPVFIQATAGMRLLPEKKREQILENICTGLTQGSDFLIRDCASQIQVIDGETEGLYGWITLNYLSGMFNKYNSTNKSHFTLGFLDMGGASTQIAFAPSDQKEVSKHSEDIATVYLKSINGDLQEWNVFVSTWLGFGANQARNRYFAQLINVLPENTNKYDDDDFETRILSDPCMPKGSTTIYNFKEHDFTIEGSGDYEKCTKMIYPLLLTNMPCIDEPCLFNGVHAPQIDFKNDKLVGTSEFWYTANDIFKLGGTYNFKEYNQKVKEFCNTDWETIKRNGEQGLYNNIPESFLIASCFKANWILNVLHEGFSLPRIDAESSSENSEFPLFKSAANVNGIELSWTLGRILLYASGSILVGNDSGKVGIEPSSIRVLNEGKKFLSGYISRTTMHNSHSYFFKIIAIIFLLLVMLLTLFRKSQSFKGLSHSSLNKVDSFVTNHRLYYPSFATIHQFISKVKMRIARNRYTKLDDRMVMLEEGIISNDLEEGDSGTLRMKSKSMFELGPNRNIETARYNTGGANFSRTTVSTRSGPPSSSSSHTNRVSQPMFSMTDFSELSKPSGSR
ncbi:hypothetical protein TBLA_0A01060 [Henningerozyma blattae CBS 6284]|uniref:Golgi apyrase n=1 Tax=Henningerozyma blattae (strain ATCC 34711 / CBS 6284 / DSM 70876 / NBRC 10599 / NRRL Y-10934 / UCD 77-7) TaxID=1071380 RepID=I2GUV4_HENB6|nr:hypothetical protein TBLA_0A01060 [Tetrapisispora blattae CBS 6284]CCH57906.1 hypothetical protein TBLA_0A01060 [Tetrapisispora blattae CBS 6284]